MGLLSSPPLSPFSDFSRIAALAGREKKRLVAADAVVTVIVACTDVVLRIIAMANKRMHYYVSLKTAIHHLKSYSKRRKRPRQYGHSNR